MSNEKLIVLTYGTYDMFHIGHLNLLRRLKGFGSKLIVGVSTDEFNAMKGKKTVIPYADRAAIVAGVRYVDAVFEESSWSQKRDDIHRFQVDIFAMGGDWEGKFDDLSDICQVTYVPRTPGVSTTEIKALAQRLNLPQSHAAGHTISVSTSLPNFQEIPANLSQS